MKLNWKVIIVVLVAFVLLVFGIPILINRAYQFPAITSWLAMSWDAKDALNYYGVIVGAIVAGAGVAFSVLYSQKNYKYIQEQYRDDLRNRVLPYFAITMQWEKYDHSYFTLFPDEIEKNTKSKHTKHNEYYKYIIDQIYFVLLPSEIQARVELDEQDKDLLEHAGESWKKEKNGYALTGREIISVPLLLQNVGLGIAVETRIGFNRVGDDCKYIAPVVISKETPFPVHIYCGAVCDTVYGEYNLDIVYKDILGNRYRQRYPITLEKTNEGKIVEKLNFVGKQEHIEGDL